MTRDFRTLEKLRLDACEIAAASNSTRFNPTRTRARAINRYDGRQLRYRRPPNYPLRRECSRVSPLLPRLHLSKLCNEIYQRDVSRKGFFVASLENSPSPHLLPPFSLWPLLVSLPPLAAPMLRIRGAFMYVCIPARTYTRQTSLGITHVTLRYLVPYPQFLNYSQTTAAFCSNTPEGSRVLSPPPSLSRSLSLSLCISPPLSLRAHFMHISAQRGELLLSFHSITFVRTCPSPCLSALLFGVDERRKVDNRR